ncbi:MAG TPA: hypothetical protein VFV38_09340 [Ktedonobacteraceae bacterium]|nr:hypothetical protein [Ktedonobacteraceae bacterium]
MATSPEKKTPLRRPEPIARKKPGKIVPLAQQLVLPAFGATG